ncbi:hypothetical protein Hsc_2514 [Herbaspirillum seropedicae]|nr:hypothetical protein Hsc_2514 [Herbaspirillum seropedicae]MDR6394151.1 hypothetical protein [Herbaspirillum seropedicae]
MPTLKPGTFLPTSAEDAEITAAALADPDAQPLSPLQLAQLRPLRENDRPDGRCLTQSS